MNGRNDRLRVIDLEHQPGVALVAELDYDRLVRVPQIPERTLTVADEAAGDDDAWELCSEQPPARRACCERPVGPSIDDVFQRNVESPPERPEPVDSAELHGERSRADGDSRHGSVPFSRRRVARIVVA
jgi:hypothetical protein